MFSRPIIRSLHFRSGQVVEYFPTCYVIYLDPRIHDMKSACKWLLHFRPMWIFSTDFEMKQNGIGMIKFVPDNG